MLGIAIAAAVLSGALSYLVGHALLLPSDSFLRSKGGALLLVVSVLVALFVPPLLMSFAEPGGPLSWPDGFDPAIYRAIWIALMALGLLLGMRVWRLGARLRGMRSFTLDESPVSRAESQLLLCDSLEEALDVLGREKVSAKDVERIGTQVRRVGSRFWHEVPEKKSDAYKMVAEHLPPSVAASVTGLLLEGAARKPR